MVIMSESPKGKMSGGSKAQVYKLVAMCKWELEMAILSVER